MIINLPCYEIELEVKDGSGWISSSLSNDRPSEHETPTDPYYAAIDALESMVLAHACAGIDISTPQYLEGLEVAIEAIADNYGD